MINKFIQEKEKEFDKKILSYDKDGGFMVYVEDYDNGDFDTDLIKKFLSSSLLQYNTLMVEKVERLKLDSTQISDSKREAFNELLDDIIKLLKE